MNVAIKTDGPIGTRYRIGALVSLASIAMLFTSLSSAYIVRSGLTLDWFPIAVPLDPSQVAQGLTSTLTLLAQQPPPDLGQASIKEVWNWAVNNWRPQALAGKAQARCP